MMQIIFIIIIIIMYTKYYTLRQKFKLMSKVKAGWS